MATGASTPSSRRTSSPVQRCEASERPRQPNRRERSSSGGASVEVQHCRHPSFGSAVSRASTADLSRSSHEIRVANRLPPLCATSQRLAAKSALATWEFAQDRRKSAPMPAAPRRGVERRHVDADDQPLTRPVLPRRLSVPKAQPLTESPPSDSGQRGRRRRSCRRSQPWE